MQTADPFHEGLEAEADSYKVMFLQAHRKFITLRATHSAALEVSVVWCGVCGVESVL
jgi:hypothetical protein